MRFPLYIPFVAVFVIAAHVYAIQVLLREDHSPAEPISCADSMQETQQAEPEKRQQNPLLVASPIETTIEDDEKSDQLSDETLNIADLSKANEETYQSKDHTPEEPAITMPKSAVETALMMRDKGQEAKAGTSESDNSRKAIASSQEPEIVDMPAIPKPEAAKQEESVPSPSSEQRGERAFVPLQSVASH